MTEKTTALVPVEQYAIMQHSAEDIARVMMENAGAAGLTLRDFERVSFPTGGNTQFIVNTLEGTENVDELLGICVAFRDLRVMWKTSFAESGGGAPPDCYSDDLIAGHGSPGGECAHCPLNEFGSADQGDGKKCKQYRLLFMLSKNAVLPFILSIPPSSLQDCRRFFMRFSARGRAFRDHIISVKLIRDKSRSGISYSRAVFSVQQALDETARALVESYSRAMSTMLGDISAQTAIREAVETATETE